MPVIRVVLVVAALALSGVARAETSPDTQEAVGRVREALVALRHGGYVIVLAHGPATADEQDADGAAPNDCAAQQSLSDTGRLMASGIGKWMAREHVPVGAVLSSRYCRCVETAERISQHTHAATLRRLDDLGDAQAPGASGERPRRTVALRRLASSFPGSGLNTVVVTHRSNIDDAFGAAAANARDGELFIVRPSRDAGGRAAYRLVYRLSVEDLSAHARALHR